MLIKITLILLFSIVAICASHGFLGFLDDFACRQAAEPLFMREFNRRAKILKKVFIWGLVIGGISYLLFLMGGSVLAVLLGPLLGMGGILFWKKERTLIWKQNLIKETPDFLDLMAMALMAGMNFENAWATALHYLSPGHLKTELSVLIQRISQGATRIEALQNLDHRLQMDEWTCLISSIRQSLLHGQPLQQVFFDQAEHLRTVQLLKLEKHAQTANLRLLIPIFLFLLPGVFLVLFAPIFIRFSKGMTIF
jgi:tight adherence protein C